MGQVTGPAARSKPVDDLLDGGSEHDGPVQDAGGRQRGTVGGPRVRRWTVGDELQHHGRLGGSCVQQVTDDVGSDDALLLCGAQTFAPASGGPVLVLAQELPPRPCTHQLAGQGRFAGTGWTGDQHDALAVPHP